MSPIFADAIDLPMLLIGGIIVLVPLMVFEVFVEALVLRKTWRLPYTDLVRFTFSANCWSLLAGIPTKFLNAFLAAQMLPSDIPGFLTRYPIALALGAAIYFVVTVLVERTRASSWFAGEGVVFPRKQVWLGILLANLATYAVLAPLYYYHAQPHSELREVSNDTHWTANPAQQVLFVDASDHHLKSVRLDGSKLETIVPEPMTDYLLSTDLTTCLFRGTNHNLYLFRRGQPTKLVWQTDERYFMQQVAFSASGSHVAYGSHEGKVVEVLDLVTGKRGRMFLLGLPEGGDLHLVWSLEESKLFVHNSRSSDGLMLEIDSTGNLASSPFDISNSPPVLKCYGRASDNNWWSGDDWGGWYSEDSCGELKASGWSGLDSSLLVYREEKNKRTNVLNLTVRTGLLRIADFYFSDIAFVPDCGEMLFACSGNIYLLDIKARRLGTLAKGDRFILLTPRYEKTL